MHGIFQARVLEWGAIAFSEDPREIHTSPELYAYNPRILELCGVLNQPIHFTDEENEA